MDKRVYKHFDVDRQRTVWVADMNDPNSTTLNPDALWRFRTRRDAIKFVALVDEGYDERHAAYIVTKKDTTP